MHLCLHTHSMYNALEVIYTLNQMDIEFQIFNKHKHILYLQYW